MRLHATKWTLTGLFLSVMALALIPMAFSGNAVETPRWLHVPHGADQGLRGHMIPGRGGWTGRLTGYSGHGGVRHGADGGAVSFRQFYAMTQGIMRPGKRYHFRGCLYYEDGEISIGPENIYSSKLIPDVDANFDNRRQLASLLRDGDQYCGKIVAELDQDGNIAVVRFH